MKIDLSAKIALVTGGNRGIGLGIADALGQAGATVLICARNAESLTAAKQKLEAKGHRVESYILNIADAEQTAQVVKEIIAKYERIDILVNNAAIANDKLAMRMSQEDWQSVLDINLTGAFNLIKNVMRPMMKNRFGRIVNITSIVGITGNAGQSNYAASKAGLIGLTKSLAKELASRNITVNAIAPGFIETDMTSALTPEVKAKYMENIPLGRFGTPEDVANACLFLSSDLANYVTGQVIVVDGGMVM